MKTSIFNKKPLAENWKTQIVVNILIKRESVFYGIRKKRTLETRIKIRYEKYPSQETKICPNCTFPLQVKIIFYA